MLTIDQLHEAVDLLDEFHMTLPLYSEEFHKYGERLNNIKHHLRQEINLLTPGNKFWKALSPTLDKIRDNGAYYEVLDRLHALDQDILDLIVDSLINCDPAIYQQSLIKELSKMDAHLASLLYISAR